MSSPIRYLPNGKVNRKIWTDDNEWPPSLTEMADALDAANARIRELEAAQQAPTSEEISRMIESLECCEFPVADEAAIFIRRLDRERQEWQKLAEVHATVSAVAERRAEAAEEKVRELERKLEERD